MSRQAQNKGYEKPFFQPINKQNGFFWYTSPVQEKLNVIRQAKKKKR